MLHAKRASEKVQMKPLIGVLLCLGATSARAQCAERDTTCWNSVYRADSIQRDSETRAFAAKISAEGNSNRLQFARRFGCTSVARSDTLWPPRLGQTLCQVLKRTGVPDRQSSVSVAGGETLYWYYEGDAKTHLVVFRGGRVVGVVW